MEVSRLPRVTVLVVVTQIKDDLQDRDLQKLNINGIVYFTFEVQTRGCKDDEA